MAVNGPNSLIRVIDVFPQIANKGAELGRNSISDSIRNIDRRCAFSNCRLNDAIQELRLGARSIFAGKFDVVGVFLCDANRFNGTGDDLLRRHIELLFHVKGRSRNERMDTASRGCGNGLSGFSHIGRICPGKRTNRRVTNYLGDCADGFKVSGRGGSKTCLNHINTQEFKLLSDTEFVLRAHACARTLFSVTKSCIENKKLVSCSCHCCIWPQKLLRSEHH